MRCRSRRTSSSARCQSTDSQPEESSSGPFTIRCPTCPSVPGPAASSPHRLTWPRQHPFGSGQPPVSGRLSLNGRRRGRPSCPAFPLPFGHRHSLLGHPVPARGSAFLTVSPPALPGRIPSGFPRSAQLSCDRGGCPLYPGDGGVLPAGGSLSGRHPPLRCGQSLHPAGAFRLAGPKRDEASSRVHSRSPVRSSPCL